MKTQSANACNDLLKVSVIIISKNRSQALDELSLPSLLRQGWNGFKVIVWDFSCNDESEKVCKKYKPLFEDTGIDFTFVRAPREGTASQRNDAVMASGADEKDVIFFVDDDCIVGIGGVKAISEAFTGIPWLMGAALPLIDIFQGSKLADKNVQFSRDGKLRVICHTLFKGVRPKYRVVRKSTANTRVIDGDDTGPAEWLSGCDMAFRRSVFNTLHFDERLEYFGGYAMWEDVDMSHRVFLHYKKPLLIVNGPNVIHMKFPGKRMPSEPASIAQTLLNSWLTRENFRKYIPAYGALSFLWARRIGRFVKYIVRGGSIKNYIAGYKMYRAARCSFKKI